MKRILQLAFNKLGLEIRRKASQGSEESNPPILDYQEQMCQALERFSKLGFNLNTVVDVGAAEGKWALLARRFFITAKFVLFEPLQERTEVLRNLVSNYSNFVYIPKAAGKGPGTVNFSVSVDLDGSGVTFDDSRENIRSVEVVSIGTQLSELGLKGPYIIKLDTHGFEVPILEGCLGILEDVQLFIIECYGFEIVKDSLLFWQMCQKMDGYGFRVFDVVDIMHRSKDGAFWQCDIFFIPKSHRIFVDNQYA